MDKILENVRGRKLVQNWDYYWKRNLKIKMLGALSFAVIRWASSISRGLYAIAQVYPPEGRTKYCFDQKTTAYEPGNPTGGYATN